MSLSDDEIKSLFCNSDFCGEVMEGDEIRFARAVIAADRAKDGEPFCYASVNKQGDVRRTVMRADGWCKTPLYTRPPAAVPDGWRDAVRVFYNLTIADKTVIIRPQSAEQRDRIIVAAERVRELLAAPAAPEVK